MRKGKKIFSLLLAMTMLFAVCGSSIAMAADDAETMTFQVSCSENPNSLFAEVLFPAFDEITEKTDGRLAFEFFPSNQLGSITDMLEQMQAGAPLICSMGLDNLGDVAPDLAPASFPYVFNSLDEVLALGKSDWMAAINEQLIEQSVQPLCYGAIGYRHFISTFPMASAEDCKGHIIRMGPSSAAQGFITVMGGTPTTTVWSDNYSLLQTGVIEACEAPLSSLWSASFQEVCSYVCLSGHFVNPFSLVINPMYWEQISPEDQQIVTDTLAAACEELVEKAAVDEEQYIEMFEEAGVTVTEPDKESFAAVVPDLFELLDLDPSIYDDIRAAVEENM